MILDIERSWSKEPGWFEALDHDTQVQLLAEHRVRHSPRTAGPGGKGRRAKR